MAETSVSVSTMSEAAKLREAARRTMRRKQAPENISNGLPNIASSASSSPSPTKGIPAGPRGLGVEPPVILNYGEANDPMVVDQPAQPPTQTGVGIAAPPVSNKLIRRTSLTRGRAAVEELNTTNGSGSREEGEISDEETKARRRDQFSRTENESTPADPMVPRASTYGASNGLITNGNPPTLKLGQTRPSSSKQSPNPRRVNSISNMAPPPLPSNGHREPAPISPTASTAPQSAIPIRSLRSSSISNGFQSLHRRHTAPTPQTHSFSGLVGEDVVMGGFGDGESLSPKTAFLNQEAFTKLLELGVDDDHCRPGLPSTFFLLPNSVDKN
jgi:hypothetical protein